MNETPLRPPIEFHPFAISVTGPAGLPEGVECRWPNNYDMPLYAY